ncbi:hypothetical protein SELMODRAFT_105243 [Selaginella moellendorffii]|uniref:Pectate lyase superfamily protein domain-containing protein n=1 Tax=Selaginella moellendorffii TaxID=88036 RepID=D8RYY8_SELML|nr:probable polygalacturonase At2g43860 [Selaginella moellendorffii]EFJ22654.1 hypothetical protein SELMODRAFT_105243 [Selaginella moellendorffii]|eukprot:XP_002976394.1 probable polygalacturonase At2g43860 [Selaginella moellendorffii]
MGISGIVILFAAIFLSSQSQCAISSSSARNFPLLLDHGHRWVCNVLDFGAVADGKTIDTSAIQSAIDYCAWKARASSLHFPPGKYLTGAVFLASNMAVVIDPGAIILGSSRQEDYPRERSRWYVLAAENAVNVSVTGGGIIDGRGLEFVSRFWSRKNVMVSWNTTGACIGDECRPRLLGFVNCENVRVWNIHLRQPAYWSLHVANSSGIYIHDITLYGDFNTPNNDGIDIDGSNNTYITNCRLDTADDGIVVKSIAGPVSNVSVTNSWIRSKSCAVKIGSETYHDLDGLYFDSITIVESHRGLGVQLRDKGNIFNVTFSNIVLSTRLYDPLWWGRAEPIYVTACPRNLSTSVGTIDSVRFINISSSAENGIFLAGSDGGVLNRLELSNVSVRLGRITDYPGGLHDYRPGCQGLVHHRTAGVFMKHVHEVTVKDVNLHWERSGVEDWDLPVDFEPRTIGRLWMSNFTSSA